jgi:hypothetical protein
MSHPWPKATIFTDANEQKSAIAPLIISASRSTDIPAFFAPWFMRRLEIGYVRWVNPWNGSSVYVSLREARCIVFWSKNPAPLFPFLHELDKRGVGYFFHYTLNDYEREGYEPGVPPLGQRIATLKRLSRTIGRDRVLWRFDPLMVSAGIGPNPLVKRIERIGNEIAGFVERLTFSFLTPYVKVTRNLRRAGAAPDTLTDENRSAIAQSIARLGRAWGLPVVTCAEERDFGVLGIKHGKCIDDDHIARVFGGDNILMRYLGRDQPSGRLKCLKDSGQRPQCGCIASKDIGSYNTCGHGCVYCYANATPGRRRCGALEEIGDSLAG